VSLIQQRSYVQREKRVLFPTPLGLTVCDMLVEYFPDLFDYDFTAQMEHDLDEIANGRKRRLNTLQSFWEDMEPALIKAKAEMPTVTVKSTAGTTGVGVKAQPTGAKCPDCGGSLVTRRGRYGPFVGCSNYPRCKYTARI
jgi:DNA topoisomerase-1